MKRITGIFIILLLATSTQLHARDYINLRQNRTYLTLGSCGFVNAANVFYERQLAFLKHSEFNLKIGVGYLDVLNFVGDFHGATATVGFGFVRGYAYNYFEFNFGATVFCDINEYIYEGRSFLGSTNLTPSLYLGYRYKKPYNPIFWRVGAGWPEQISAGFGVGF